MSRHPLFERYGFGPAVRPRFDRIHHAFEAFARRHPDQPAVSHEGETLTYGELDDRAERLAAVLAAAGAGPGEHVGLFVRRSIPMVVGILAVLKTGAAYVPQDVRIAPPGHLAHIVATASIKLVLTGPQAVPELPPHCRTIDLTAPRPKAVRPVPAIGRYDTAVVIFTSGTTGRPNGVRVTHANLCNTLLTGPGSLGIRPGQKVGQILNIAFDMAVWEILGALSHGATLVVRGNDIERTAAAADVLIATPSVLARLDPVRCRGVSVVAVAGERCPRDLADTWAAFTAFHNSCGPTEVTIVNTLSRYRPGEGELTIGRPLPNTSVYVLRDDLTPCAIGEVGEMWAGGACVTAGYLSNDTLTAERYRPDPYLGGRMFRTRDLVRWTADGLLEHHGRTDDQVKVRGFRVELDAVTAALELTPGCRRATTILHDGELVGFVSPSTVDPDLAKQVVGANLPYYCTPARIVAVDDLPVTDRGKIDRSSLRARLELVVA